jgi:hypothetical protein
MRNRITGLLKGVAFTIFVALLGFCASAQDDVKHRWLDCDVIWAISNGYKVGSDLTVKVTFHDTPVSAARIVLVREGFQTDSADNGRVASRDTDSLGFADFFGIPPGRYEAHIEGGLLTPAAPLEVVANSIDADHIELQWPAEALAVRSLHGKLVKAADARRKIRPLRGASVELLDLRTARTIARTTTDAKGNYDLPATAPGLYALRISLLDQNGNRGSDRKDLAIELKPESAREKLPTLEAEKNECSGFQVSQPKPKGPRPIKSVSSQWSTGPES